MTLRFAHRCVPKAGESACGDACFVREERGTTLLAVIDGLGHGEQAAAAARSAVAYLDAAPLGRARDLMDGLHRALRGTRGAAATLCLVRASGALEGVGVGNVELRAHPQRIPFLLSPGILGGNMQRLRVFQAVLGPGDRLALFSDGLSRLLALEAVSAKSVEDACEILFDEHCTGGDDTSLLVAEVGA